MERKIEEKILSVYFNEYISHSKENLSKVQTILNELEPHILSDEFLDKTRNDFAPFVFKASEIKQKEESISEKLKSSGIKVSRFMRSVYYKEVLEDMRFYMNDLSSSKAYRDVFPWVDEEVNRLFVVIRIVHCGKDNSEKSKTRIAKAKQLLKTDSSAAANLFIGMGSCHLFWFLRSMIFKYHFGIAWYSPSDLSPDTFFD